MVVSSGLDFGEVQPGSTLQMSTAPTLDNPLSPIFQFSPCKGTKPLAHSVSDLIKYFVASFKCGVSSMLCSQIPCQLFKIAVMESGGHEFLQYAIANIRKAKHLALSLGLICMWSSRTLLHGWVKGQEWLLANDEINLIFGY